MTTRKRLLKILLWAMVLTAAIALLLLCVGFPSPSAEFALRKAEKQHLIGPCQIMTCLDFPNGAYDHILIGQSEYGYTFFECNSPNYDDGKLTYVERREGATLYCTYSQYGSEEWGRDWLPVFAMVDNKSAVTAKLTLTTTHSGQTVTYPLEAGLSASGLFLFSWKTLELRSYDYWLVQQMIARHHDGYLLDGTAQATLELYNSRGELLETYRFTK